MNKLLRALVKHNAVRIEDGRIVPTTNRKPKESAAVFSDQQLLLADAEGVTILSPRAPEQTPAEFCMSTVSAAGVCTPKERA